MKVQSPKEVKPDISRLWKAMRVEGWNFRQLSEASHISYHQVRDTMNGKSASAEVIRAICFGLGIPVEEVWK